MGLLGLNDSLKVSTHSRPKAAGFAHRADNCKLLFQHTAARRRLEQLLQRALYVRNVSTHSRPKAAGAVGFARYEADDVSTHSRPKAAGLGFALLCR